MGWDQANLSERVFSFEGTHSSVLLTYLASLGIELVVVAAFCSTEQQRAYEAQLPCKGEPETVKREWKCAWKMEAGVNPKGYGDRRKSALNSVQNIPETDHSPGVWKMLVVITDHLSPVKWVCAWDQLCSICPERSQESEPEKWGLEGFKLAKCALAGQRGPVCPQLISSKSSYVMWPRNKQMSTECPPPARHSWRCSSSVSLPSWKISCC